MKPIFRNNPKRKSKHSKVCFFSGCINTYTHGFLSKFGNIQVPKYCKIHAELIKIGKSFPNCKMVKL